MMIQCPACKAQATLPESKEGAKVRCAECSRVYVARPLGARAKKEDPTKYFVIGGVVLVIALVIMWVNSQPETEIVVVEEAPPKPEVVEAPSNGWDATMVKLAREFHELVLDPSSAESGLLVRLDPEYVYRLQNQVEPEEPAEDEPPSEAATDYEPGPLQPEAVEWAALGQTEQQTVMFDAVADLFTGDSHELVADWKPYDGWVVSETDTVAVVRLKVSSRDHPEEADRHIEWRFVKRGLKWKAWYWQRWYSPEELAAQRRARTKKTTKKTLSDGSLVIEGEKRVLGHLEDTPQELRDEIDRLIGDLTDIDARPRIYTEAQKALFAIGRPAVPPLLSQLAELPLETDEDAMRLQRVHLMLGDLTGYLTTFDVHDAMGGSKERRESGLLQWFGWYDRKWKKYTGPPSFDGVPDPLSDLKPRNEKEAREFEKALGKDDGR